jgi:hypothetical protein
MTLAAPTSRGTPSFLEIYAAKARLILTLVPHHINCKPVGATGFEPTTSTSRTWRATGLRYAPK